MRINSGRSIQLRPKFFVLLTSLVFLPLASLAESSDPSRLTALKEGWKIQSACKFKATGEQISSKAFETTDWLSANIPSTVLTAQVKNGLVKDPYFADNLRKIPGTDYPVGRNFANLPISPDSPYQCSWWYRKEFTIPASEQGRTLLLKFDGINYRANIWLNGKRIADSSQIAGAYRTYELNISKEAVVGKTNVLAIETFAPTEKDLGINWVDWNPCPPDKNMGLWGGVNLLSSGPVTVRSPLVTTHLPSGADGPAVLTVYAELQNTTPNSIKGTVHAELLGTTLKQEVTLEAGETKTVIFHPEDYPALHVEKPGLWWPYQMGTPHLQNLHIRFSTRGKVSDEQTARFGIREITSELTDKGFRLFKVNGKPILIRGAGWSQDMLLREDTPQLSHQFQLVRDMHLNTIRLEGKLETETFFRMADEQGILVMLGWCCCDQWEQWQKWTPENLSVAKESLRSQMLRLRNYASLFVWLNGSDNPPTPEVEQAYLQIEKDTHWPNPTLSSATRKATTVSGETGVKMTGPYDYVAPSYWLIDKEKYGGAHGFNTETGPGPAIPTLASLKTFIPAEHLWPQDDVWALHYGGGGFKTLTVFNGAMDASYGKPQSVEEYVRTAQTMTFDTERAMFEAYGRNKYTSTGVIQWMLNNAWPSMIWHLYDYYLHAGGGYYGTKKACEPLHIQYSYDDHSVAIVNSRYEEARQLTATVHVYDFDLKELFSKTIETAVAADASIKALNIPDSVFQQKTSVFFIQLGLKDATGKVVSDNFYWVPASLTEFQWDKTDYTHTPALRHEDLKQLQKLPPAGITIKAVHNTDHSIHVELKNPSPSLAFQVAISALGADNQEIAPVLWSDNYVELLPGETRELQGKSLAGPIEKVQLSGWNVKAQTISASAAPGKATGATHK